MIINKDHPINLYTHIKDKDGNEHYFKYIEIENRPNNESSIILEGLELIDFKTNKWKYWSKNMGEPCPYDYYVKGEKNPSINRINWLTFKDTLKPYDPIIKH